MTKVSKKDQKENDESASERSSKRFDMINGENGKEAQSEKTSKRFFDDMSKLNNDEEDNNVVDIEFNVNDVTDEIEPEAAKGSLTQEINSNEGISLEFTKEHEGVLGLINEASESQEDSGFEINGELLESIEQNDEERTKLTEVFKLDVTNPDMSLNQIEIDKELLEKSNSADHMDVAEAKANIEMTIKDIVRPAPEDLSLTLQEENSKEKKSLVDEIEDSVLEFRDHTPTAGIKLPSELQFGTFNEQKSDETQEFVRQQEPSVSSFDNVADDDLESLLEVSRSVSKVQPTAISSEDSTDEFDLSDVVENLSMDFDDKPGMPDSGGFTQVGPLQEMPRKISEHANSFVPSGSMTTKEVYTENSDALRFQSTIRALREEREELLSEIKNLKNEVKERTQDQLSSKASFDETKIEISILRKRHLAEIEDYKYRLSISEEKRAIAEEKARHLEIQKEKIEQRVRIDYNQVKQREKELESKLELMSMDIDTQVQSREHKILELRRKIDALEFNIENASIREQKSQEDKRRLDEKLNKVMKMLRHSINSLEDEYENNDESLYSKDKNK